MKSRRVLIASSHPLFGQGLRSLLHERRAAGVEVVGMATSLEQALEMIEKHKPDLVIVDYDDQSLNRDEFLARFVEGESKLRLVLLSLQSAQEALVYDRRSLAASEIDDWLEEWNFADETPALRKSNHVIAENLPAGRNVSNRRNSMKHLIIAGILVILVTAGLLFGMGYVRLLPEQASAQAVPIDQLFQIHFIAIAFLFSLIVVFMLYSIVVFRRKAGDTSDARHIEGNTNLEIAWTIIPLITVMAFAVLGGQALSDTLRADPRALEVNVIGQQWAWRFEYPQYGIVSDTMYIPKDKQVILYLSSLDVIHSFWVPEFRVKQDALPGGKEFVRDLRVTATKLGEYKVRCAEMCGTQHAFMESPVIVVTQEDFEAWVAEQTGESADPVERGQKAAQTYGCLACHSLDGSALVGPSWLGVYGSQRQFVDGTSLVADEQYLLESILNPNLHIVQGYAPGLMPQNYGDQLSEQIINDIIAFIMSLK